VLFLACPSSATAGRVVVVEVVVVVVEIVAVNAVGEEVVTVIVIVINDLPPRKTGRVLFGARACC
jgi:hypothetical protein